MSVKGPAPAAAVASKPRKFFKSSAFIPAEWRFENNADGVVGLITEVVMAVDRQCVFRDAENGDVRQHIHNSGPRKPQPHHYSQQRGLSAGRHHHKPGPSSQSRPSPGHHHHSRPSSGDHRRPQQHQQQPPPPPQLRSSASLYGGPSPSQYRGHHSQNHHTLAPGPHHEPSRSRSIQGGHPRSRSIHGGGGGGSHPRSRDLDNSGMSQVNITRDDQSLFTREPGRRRSVPRNTRAVASDAPVATRCPRCKEDIMTVIKRHTGGKNIAATAAVAAAGVAINAPATLLPLALAVLDLGSLKRKAHHCPYCDYKMGRHVTITIPRD